MRITTVLVVLEGVDSDAVTAATALAVGRSFGARVEGAIVRPDPRDAVRLAIDGMSPALIEGILAAARADNDERFKRARASFEQACKSYGVGLGEDAKGGSWTEQTGRAPDFVADHGRLADLIVLGTPSEDAVSEGAALAEAALFQSGRPVLLAGPKAPENFDGTAVIAWNGSGQAARAVTAALPFLERAGKVMVLALDEPDDLWPNAERLCAYLQSHGIKAAPRRKSSGGAAVGDRLIELARDEGAALLVMGGYGHSRLRELVLGGVTRRVLARPGLAVLMAH